MNNNEVVNIVKEAIDKSKSTKEMMLRIANDLRYEGLISYEQFLKASDIS